MEHPELFVPALFVAVAALSVVARAVSVPYPIFLVVAGLGLGFVPGVPSIELEPDLVLVLFLPPLLYSAAFFSNLRDLRAELRPISMLSVGLVLLTTVGVAVVAHAVIDGLPWAGAFALGAVVSPTDPIAATAVARRLEAPRRFVTIVEGESLVNDATALVLYRVAVAAAVGGSFSLFDAGFRFFAGAAGGIAIGLVVGWVVARIRRPLDDPPIEITISLFTAYAAYVPADELGASGVLAAVTTGIYMGWQAPKIASPTMRLQGFAVWDILVYLLNSTLFILIGLQLPGIVDDLDGAELTRLIGYAALVSAVVIGLRLLWMNTIPFVVRAIDRRPSQVERRAGWRERLIVGWSGMRGAVSLAAALAIPLETDAGQPFPGRDVIVACAFGVILSTLVFQGLTLPWLIRRLGVADDDAEEREELRARLDTAQAALDRLDELAREDWTRDETIERMRGLYRYRLRRFGARAGEEEDDGLEERSLAYQRSLHQVLDAQRGALVRLRDEGTISSDVMRRIERELDLEETRLEV